MKSILNERPSTKQDGENKISLPEIGTQRQLLLIYEASAELHAAGLKGRIAEFLLNYEVKVSNIQAHMNSSLYFRVNTPFTDTMLRKLSADFEGFVSQLEKEFKGRVFWLINTVAQLKIDEGQTVRAAIVGKGNKTVYTEVAEEIKKIPVVVTEPEIQNVPVITPEPEKKKIDVVASEPEIKNITEVRTESTSEEKAFVLKGLRRGPKKD